MELLCEFLFEMYCELMFLIVPEEKTTSKTYRWLSIAVATVVLLSVLALFVWGGVLLFDHGDKRGSIPIIIAAVISVVHIVAGIVLYNRNSKQ